MGCKPRMSPHTHPYIRFVEAIKFGDCWEWQRSVRSKHSGSKGYGAFMYKGVMGGAHRFSYEMFFGKIPKGLIVCHSCDNSLCVNPNHLWLGTFKQNSKDASNKKRLWMNKVTHCPKGHEYNKENTRIYKNTRSCIQCIKLYRLFWKESGRGNLLARQRYHAKQLQRKEA